MELIDRKPIKDVSLVELFENTIDFRESCYDAILDFADRFRKAHPTIYDNEYEFVELKLTEHAIPVPCSPFTVPQNCKHHFFMEIFIIFVKHYLCKT